MTEGVLSSISVTWSSSCSFLICFMFWLRTADFISCAASSYPPWDLVSLFWSASGKSSSKSSEILEVLNPIKLLGDSLLSRFFSEFLASISIPIIVADMAASNNVADIAASTSLAVTFSSMFLLMAALRRDADNADAAVIVEWAASDNFSCFELKKLIWLPFLSFMDASPYFKILSKSSSEILSCWIGSSTGSWKLCWHPKLFCSCNWLWTPKLCREITLFFCSASFSISRLICIPKLFCACRLFCASEFSCTLKLVCIWILFLASTLVCIWRLFLASILVCIWRLFLASILVCMWRLFLASILVCMWILFLTSPLFFSSVGYSS